MKKLLLIFFTLSFLTPQSSLFSIRLHAQSAMVQKAARSVFSLTTFKADGTILATSHGVFCGENGEAISAFTPFIGASSAVIIDAAGKKSPVEAIIGANDIYDICRFKVDCNVFPISVAEKVASGKVFAIGYSVKRPSATPLTIKSAEPFMEKYNYYVFNEEINDEIEGCPIVNAVGEMIGLAQRVNGNYDVHSTDARYYSELKSTGLSKNDKLMQKTFIRVALPTDHEQARLMMLMINGSSDSLNVINTVADYNLHYPSDVDGYAALTRYQVAHNNLTLATQAMEDCVRNAGAKDEAYSEYAKQVYGVAVYTPDSVQCPWTLDLAEKEIKEAIAVNGLSAYKNQLAQIYYAKGEYQKAFDIFDEISKTDMSNSEIYYELAQCKSHLGATNEELLTYLNKSVEASPKPLTNISAPYIYARGIVLDAMGEYKKAMADYNDYDTLMYLRANDQFYYRRYKCETKIRMYQQALNDIAHAAVLNPREATYLAEMASLQLRVGQYENAIKTCELSKHLTDQYADIYIIEGVSYMKLEKKEEARAAFEKAKELGDERADEYLSKLQ